MDQRRLRVVLRELFAEQLFAVLATAGERGPHLNIVSFAAADELRTILFATPRRTAKFANLQAHPGVCLFVDNRSNRPRDLKEAYAVEVSGTAAEVQGDAAPGYRALYLARFPQLGSFLDSPDTALMAARVRRYDLVHRFQEAVFWEIGS